MRGVSDTVVTQRMNAYSFTREEGAWTGTLLKIV